MKPLPSLRDPAARHKLTQAHNSRAVCQTFSPLPPGFLYCRPSRFWRVCAGGLLWCTNGCAWYVCGICFRPPIVVLWPPALPGPGPVEIAPGPLIYANYQNLTDTDLKTWLDGRGIRTEIQGRDRLFEFAVGQLSSISCRVGVTNRVKDV